MSKSWPYFSNKRSVFSKLTYVVFLNSSLLPPHKLPCWSSLNNMHKDFGFLRTSHWDFLLRQGIKNKDSHVIHSSGLSKGWDSPLPPIRLLLYCLLCPQSQRCFKFSVLGQIQFSKTASHIEQLGTKLFPNPGWEVASQFLLLHSIAMTARRLT